MITRLTARTLTSPHGFLGRTGGVSTGIFASLNVGLGSSDDQAHVRENRSRALAAVAPAARLVTLHQVHSARAVEAGNWLDDARPEADGLATNRPGLALGILTADCAPLLFEDAEAGVIGACHAGWKGAFTGVIAATVDLMEQLGASRHRIAAAIGPCIGRRSYEVDTAFRQRFEDADPDNELFFTDGRENHAFFDLEGFCLKRLAESGITRAEGLGADTKSDPDRFFSYRRKTLAGEPDYGRQISLIALPG
ncbi:peptidoglycan editing factor PgeF [Sandaracinobacter neustonicus]|uniref:Purine nucleoside phosphorylase n=1 Tax=Sandaracinobacter neustonicus TaxID=1715348 RepID=A0A501XGK2_9SPHN|nr:peptidoglycan editing factor PgeF [Sandaracinobacter neustonicus]TPE59447.1 peptidoglycan editing factor PgeF [Sandaracinobacter neustonicus]